MEQGRLSVFAATAVETEAGKNAAFVTVEIDEAVVAVIIYRGGAEDDEENNRDKEEEHDRNHDAAMTLTERAAFFQAEPAMRAHTGRIRYLVFALRAIDK